MPNTSEVEKRLALMKDLLNDPPFWFEHALTYCRFESVQLKELLLKGVVTPSLNKRLAERCSASTTMPKSSASTTMPKSSALTTKETSRIKCAVECDLLEPILHSVADCTVADEYSDMIETLKEASQMMNESFPWMFLAYLGTRTHNTQLVEKCVHIITSGEPDEANPSTRSRLPTDEIGMSYMVWRFLVRANGGAVVDALLTQIEANQIHKRSRHDWTFVHLAAAYGDQDCIQILLRQQCNQNHDVLRAATKLEGFTPLHLAAWFGHATVVGLLLEHADTYSNSTNAGDVFIPIDRLFGRSPLHYACHYSHFEVVQMLVEKWSSVGVDLQDRFGVTCVHLATMPYSLQSDDVKRGIMALLIEVAEHPNQKVAKDYGLQKAMMTRFFLDRRAYIDSLTTTSSLFIPTPSIIRELAWTFQGFTALHLMSVFRDGNDFKNLLDRGLNWKLNWAAEDCEGLNPIDYAEYSSRFHGFLAEEAAIAVLRQPQRHLVNHDKVHSIVSSMESQDNERSRLWWVYEMDLCLLSGRYIDAQNCVTKCEEYIKTRYGATREYKVQLDDEVWDHLEWALQKALRGSKPVDHGKIVHVPRLHPSDVEGMVLMLVRGKMLYGKSTLQRCLQWAIGNRMAVLAEELVKDMECELMTVVPGSEHEESPLARASKSRVAKEMPGLLVAMELRDDVKRSWYEERQVYVDFANTLLVGAILIAGLAFAGWLQPPRGYVDGTGTIDTKQPAIQVFVCSSTLAFSLGMATMVAAATGAMPFSIGAGLLVSARLKVRKAVVIAGLLLVASIACLTISFSSAALAILPSSRNLLLASLLAFGGLLLCWMLFSFLKRLQELLTSSNNINYKSSRRKRKI